MEKKIIGKKERDEGESMGVKYRRKGENMPCVRGKKRGRMKDVEVRGETEKNNTDVGKLEGTN